MITKRRDRPENLAELLVRARDGDTAACEEIVRRYSPVVFATVRSFRMQDADALDAVQMTWLRMAENLHRVQQYPERLAGWLAITARRECLRILRQANRVPDPLLTVSADSVVDPAAGPTRARALQQLRRRLDERGLGPESDVISAAKENLPEGERTGSHRLDGLLDEVEHRLREVIESGASTTGDLAIDTDRQEEITRTTKGTHDVVPLVAHSADGTGDAHLDDLLTKADAALREVWDKGPCQPPARHQ